ncbi:unnamed protein product, partial [Soboliphyme baturini]|uniref:Ig-like domain-containing protein n=1 Tax=Soboliphyme baturini TaxID=241478 RepID=A0A183IHJ0_9BILA
MVFLHLDLADMLAVSFYIVFPANSEVLHVCPQLKYVISEITRPNADGDGTAYAVALCLVEPWLSTSTISFSGNEFPRTHHVMSCRITPQVSSSFNATALFTSEPADGLPNLDWFFRLEIRLPTAPTSPMNQLLFSSLFSLPLCALLHAVFEFKAILSSRFSVDVSKDRIKFIREPEDVIVVNGSSASLACLAVNELGRFLKEQWLHNGRLFSRQERQPGHLVLKSVNELHEGKYQCLVLSENYGVVLSRPANVTIA